jgi:hypothetical protein
MALQSPLAVIRCAEVIGASAVIAALLVRCALEVRRAARTLEPNAEQIRAGLVRHHKREEAERRAAGAGLVAWSARTPRTPTAA